MRRIDRAMQIRIRAAIEDLQEDQAPSQAKPLSGPLAGKWRLRVGLHHRVLYRVDHATRVVTIENVSTREGAY